jgi:hypothetical protein
VQSYRASAVPLVPSPRPCGERARVRGFLKTRYSYTISKEEIKREEIEQKATEVTKSVELAPAEISKALPTSTTE